MRLTLTAAHVAGHRLHGDRVARASSWRTSCEPLDACNANGVNCADPEVLPFGCTFVMPEPAARHVQPDRRRRSSPAARGPSADAERLRRRDPRDLQQRHRRRRRRRHRLHGSQVRDRSRCAKFACRADQNVGLLPLDGTLAPAVVVQTSTAGDDEPTAMCASAPGGQDAVVDFQLPALADLTVQWAQVGNHALAIYADGGDAAGVRGVDQLRVLQDRWRGDGHAGVPEAAHGPLSPGCRCGQAGQRGRGGAAAVGEAEHVGVSASRMADPIDTAIPAAPRFDLAGRTALVTGAARGIGRGCAIALAQAGRRPCARVSRRRLGRPRARWSRRSSRSGGARCRCRWTSPGREQIAARRRAAVGALRPHRHPGQQRRHRPAQPGRGRDRGRLRPTLGVNLKGRSSSARRSDGR